MGSLKILEAWHATCYFVHLDRLVPHSAHPHLYRCGSPARFYLDYPWPFICRVPTASHPHDCFVPYLAGSDTHDTRLLIVLPASLDKVRIHTPSPCSGVLLALCMLNRCDWEGSCRTSFKAAFWSLLRSGMAWLMNLLAAPMFSSRAGLLRARYSADSSLRTFLPYTFRRSWNSRRSVSFF